MSPGRHQSKHENDESGNEDQMPDDLSKCKSRIMYIEDKSSGLVGHARIGRVYFSKTGKTLYYKDRRLQSFKGSGYKSNYIDTHTGDHFWVSGPRKDQDDRLYGGFDGVVIDDDAQAEYAEIIAAQQGARDKEHLT